MNYFDYKATPEDLKAVEDGISYAWHPKLDFIFKDKEKIKNVVVISYDSDFLYVYKHKNNPVNIVNATRLTTALENYELFKILHKIKINKNDLLGWAAGFLLNDKFPSEKIFSLPKENIVNFQIISGSLVTQFLLAQKEKAEKMPLNAYTTHDSYLATIVHEFGHAYFNNFHSWWFSDKEENLNYLNDALNLYKGVGNNNIHKINFPNYDKRLTLLSETFAFCTDYSAASIFWKGHKKDIDNMNVSETQKLIEKEKISNLFREDSVLDPNPFGHNAAMVIGKLLTNFYPKTWPEKIIHSNQLAV